MHPRITCTLGALVAALVAIALAGCTLFSASPPPQPTSTAAPAPTSADDALAGARLGLDDYLTVVGAIWTDGIDPQRVDQVATGEAKAELLPQIDAAAEQRASGWTYSGRPEFAEDVAAATVGTLDADGASAAIEFGRVELCGCYRWWMLEMLDPNGNPPVFALTPALFVGDGGGDGASIEGASAGGGSDVVALAPPTLTTIVVVFGADDAGDASDASDAGDAGAGSVGRWRVESVSSDHDGPLVDCGTGETIDG